MVVGGDTGTHLLSAATTRNMTLPERAIDHQSLDHCRGRQLFSTWHSVVASIELGLAIVLSNGHTTFHRTREMRLTMKRSGRRNVVDRLCRWSLATILVGGVVATGQGAAAEADLSHCALRKTDPPCRSFAVIGWSCDIGMQARPRKSYVRPIGLAGRAASGATGRLTTIGNIMG